MGAGRGDLAVGAGVAAGWGGPQGVAGAAVSAATHAAIPAGAGKPKSHPAIRGSRGFFFSSSTFEAAGVGIKKKEFVNSGE